MAQKKTFMRLYSMSGQILQKGFYYGVTDSSVILFKNKEKVEVPVATIGVIKLRRTSSHNILVGIGIGSATFGTLFAALGEKPQEGSIRINSWTGLKIGVFLGGIAGGLVGALVRGTKKDVSFNINGSSILWQEQKNTFQKLPALMD